MFGGEMKFANVALLEMIVIAIGCWFYSWGGRDGKWKRRFVGSLICSTAVWVGALLMGMFKLGMLGVYPLLAIAFSLGYGSEVPIIKVIKRAIVVAASLLSGVLMCMLLGGKAWFILPLQGFIGAGSIWLGVKNPMQAAAEEFFVCLLLVESLAMYPLIGTF